MRGKKCKHRILIVEKYLKARIRLKQRQKDTLDIAAAAGFLFYGTGINDCNVSSIIVFH